ncbi:C-type lectin 37Db-like [Drosophila innubila]|uniref:C-type lectin 37Db-like n=1 Tax=Drosophila innubila TaxID=198719 RepID=UPI00148C1711|nr:C-type lectin 37Db-like [Drosophila innubila]
MVGKLELLLFFLQLWHVAMPNKTLEAVSHPIQQEIPFDSSSESNFPIQIGNKFYHIGINSKVNWYQAAHNCRKLGGNLLNIESSKEMDAILSQIPQDRYWISANCLARDRDFTSITTGEPMPFFRWHKGEPNNVHATEYCVEIKRTALNDEICVNKFNYICEAKIMY